MAKIFSLKSVRVHDLHSVISSLKPADIAKHAGEDTMKNINRVSKVIDELAAADEPYVELSKELTEAVEPVRKEYQEKLKDLGKEETDALLAEANEAAKKALEEVSEKIGFKEAGEKVIEVTIASDERFDLLKKLVEKVGPELYTQTKALAETWNAIEEAKEV